MWLVKKKNWCTLSALIVLRDAGRRKILIHCLNSSWDRIAVSLSTNMVYFSMDRKVLQSVIFSSWFHPFFGFINLYLNRAKTYRQFWLKWHLWRGAWIVPLEISKFRSVQNFWTPSSLHLANGMSQRNADLKHLVYLSHIKQYIFGYVLRLSVSGYCFFQQLDLMPAIQAGGASRRLSLYLSQIFEFAYRKHRLQWHSASLE